MRCGCVAYFVDRFDDGIGSRVIAQGKVRSVKIVVNGSGDANNGNVIFPRKYLGTREGSVAANGDQSVDTRCLQVVIRLLPSLRFTERFAPGRFQNGAAHLDDVTYRTAVHLQEIAVYHSLIALVNAHDRFSGMECCTDSSTDAGIHSGRIAPGSKNSYF